MNKSVSINGWRLIVLAMVSIFVLTACDLGAAPKPTPIAEEPGLPQESGPSEADLYATAIASIGGPLTATAAVESIMKPEEKPTEMLPGEGQPAGEGQPVGEGRPAGEGVPTGEGQRAGTPIPQNMAGGSGYDSNYNPNLDSKNIPNSPYQNPNSPYYLNPNYNPASQPSGGGATTYVIQPGDWLYNIARKYGVSPESIIAANPGITPSNLYPGQVLVIPASQYGAGVPQSQGQLQYYPRYISTSVWYPEYYWSYGNNPTGYPDWYSRYGTTMPSGWSSMYGTAVPSGNWTSPDYNRYGPDNWGTIPQYALCGTGRSQSPINIDTAKVTQSSKPVVKFSYRPSDVRMVSNDFTFQIDVPSGSFMEMDGIAYQLMNITFHMPSEHTINSKPYYMEIQFNHYNSNTSKWAVVSVFVNEGTADNLGLASVWSAMPAPPYNMQQVSSFDPTVFLPMDPKMYTYSGSLSTPPCSEGVNWLIFAAPIQLSRTQIERYRSIFPYNARPAQPLNDRPVYTIP